MDEYEENALRGRWARENWARLDLARQKMARMLLVHNDAPARAVRTAWRAVSRGVPGPFDVTEVIQEAAIVYGDGPPAATIVVAEGVRFYYDTQNHVLYELQDLQG